MEHKSKRIAQAIRSASFVFCSKQLVKDKSSRNQLLVSYLTLLQDDFEVHQYAEVILGSKTPSPQQRSQQQEEFGTTLG